MLGPSVWDEITKQPWFKGSTTSVAHLRLLQTLAAARTDGNALGAIKANPDGLTLEQEDLIRVINWRPVSTVLTAAWFTDGLTPLENELARKAAAQGVTLNAFSPTLVRAQRSPWYADGLDEAERELLNIAFAAHGGAQTPAQFFDTVDAEGYKIERMTLPEAANAASFSSAARRNPRL